MTNRDNPIVVYLAHPFSDAPSENLRQVTEIAQHIIKLSITGSSSRLYAPVVPHLLLSVFDEDVNRDIRPVTEAISSALVSACDELWIVSPKISPGMQLEINAAINNGIPIRRWSEIEKLLSQI